MSGANPNATSAPAVVTATLSVTPPSGVTPMAERRSSAAPVATPNPVVYITLTAGTGGALVRGVTNVQSAFPSPVPSGQSLYLAYNNGTQWKALGGPGTLFKGTTSTYTLSGGSITPAVTLDEGKSITLIVYEGSYAVPSPTPGPATPSPSPTPSNAVSNGNFETGTFSPWFVCYTQHHQLAPTDASPVNPPSAYTSPTPGPDTSPTSAPNPDDVTVQGSTPTGAVHGGAHAALVGHSLEQQRGKGASGVCQNVTVPTNSPALTLWVYEGGNYAYYDATDSEADIFTASAGLTAATPTTTTLPQSVLFSEDNCWNNQSVPASPNSAQGPCATDHLHGGNANWPDLANGGVWRQKGPYDLTPYAGQTVTLFLGIWNSSSSTTYYDYAYYDDVVLTTGAGSATVPVTIQSVGRH